MTGQVARTVDGDESYAARVADLRRESGEFVHIDDVAELVGVLMRALPQEAPSPQHLAYDEVCELQEFIDTARREIAEMGPMSLSRKAIPSAADELDAIVEATREAAEKILDAADEIQEISGDVDDGLVVRLSDVSTKIYEASSFQDITGQRITKVVGTLQHIEEKLLRLAETFGDTHVDDEAEIELGEDGVPVDAQDLLHGPQLPEQASAQDEIDALLASFD